MQPQLRRGRGASRGSLKGGPQQKHAFLIFLVCAPICARLLKAKARVSSFDEVKAAEARMNAANDKLLDYTEKHNTIDRDHHRGPRARLGPHRNFSQNCGTC